MIRKNKLYGPMICNRCYHGELYGNGDILCDERGIIRFNPHFVFCMDYVPDELYISLVRMHGPEMAKIMIKEEDPSRFLDRTKDFSIIGEVIDND